MECCKHFSHPHKLSFHENLEGPQLIACAACNLPCAGGTPVYSCHPCNFFLHNQCFDAARSLIHPAHPAHPLTLLPSPTYPSGSFICNSCNQIGSGISFGCSICEFDLHVHCAYNDVNSNSSTNPLPKQIQLKAHPDHPLHCHTKPPQPSDVTHSCDVCGAHCDDNSALYRCDVCDYDVHLGCVNLPETVQREDHGHELSLLHMNPHEEFECDVCRGMILQKNCMYFCTSGCDYGVHVTCVAKEAVSSEKAQADKLLATQLEMLKIQNKIQMQRMAFEGRLAAINGSNLNQDIRIKWWIRK